LSLERASLEAIMFSYQRARYIQLLSKFTDQQSSNNERLQIQSSSFPADVDDHNNREPQCKVDCILTKVSTQNSTTSVKKALTQEDVQPYWPEPENATNDDNATNNNSVAKQKRRKRNNESETLPTSKKTKAENKLKVAPAISNTEENITIEKPTTQQSNASKPSTIASEAVITPDEPKVDSSKSEPVLVSAAADGGEIINTSSKITTSSSRTMQLIEAERKRLIALGFGMEHYKSLSLRSTVKMTDNSSVPFSSSQEPPPKINPPFQTDDKPPIINNQTMQEESIVLRSPVTDKQPKVLLSKRRPLKPPSTPLSQQQPFLIKSIIASPIEPSVCSSSVSSSSSEFIVIGDNAMETSSSSESTTAVPSGPQQIAEEVNMDITEAFEPEPVQYPIPVQIEVQEIQEIQRNSSKQILITASDDNNANAIDNANDSDDNNSSSESSIGDESSSDECFIPLSTTPKTRNLSTPSSLTVVNSLSAALSSLSSELPATATATTTKTSATTHTKLSSPSKLSVPNNNGNIDDTVAVNKKDTDMEPEEIDIIGEQEVVISIQSQHHQIIVKEEKEEEEVDREIDYYAVDDAISPPSDVTHNNDNVVNGQKVTMTQEVSNDEKDVNDDVSNTIIVASDNHARESMVTIKEDVGRVSSKKNDAVDLTTVLSPSSTFIATTSATTVSPSPAQVVITIDPVFSTYIAHHHSQLDKNETKLANETETVAQSDTMKISEEALQNDKIKKASNLARVETIDEKTKMMEKAIVVVEKVEKKLETTIANKIEINNPSVKKDSCNLEKIHLNKETKHVNAIESQKKVNVSVEKKKDGYDRKAPDVMQDTDDSIHCDYDYCDTMGEEGQGEATDDDVDDDDSAWDWFTNETKSTSVATPAKSSRSPAAKKITTIPSAAAATIVPPSFSPRPTIQLQHPVSKDYLPINRSNLLHISYTMETQSVPIPTAMVTTAATTSTVDDQNSIMYDEEDVWLANQLPILPSRASSASSAFFYLLDPVHQQQIFNLYSELQLRKAELIFCLKFPSQFFDR